MNYLILSSEWCDGCDSVALSIAEAAEKAGVNAIVADPAVFSSGDVKLYRKLLRKTPGSRTVRRYANKLYDKTSLSDYGIFASSSSQFFSNLNEYIKSDGFDAVIIVGLELINRLTESEREICVPTYAVISEYACPSMKGLTRYDALFAPHEFIRNELVFKGFSESRITVSGVPVPSRFSEQMGKAAARNYLVVPQKKRIYLIHCHGLSTGNVEDLCDGLLRDEGSDFSVWLLVGRDGDKRDNLLTYYAENPAVQVITYTEKVNVYMEAADVMLSKSIGIICAEGAVSSVPMVNISPVTGRDRNADFLSSREIAVKATGVREAVRKAKKFCENAVMSGRMKMIQRNNSPHCGADTVIRTITARLSSEPSKNERALAE